MKIAILMLIHNNNEQVRQLIKHLSQDFDLHVHIDKKSKFTELPYTAQNEYYYKKYRIYWGSYNVIKAELFLLKKASLKQYDRYIIISGSDIPIKSNREICNFFIDNNKEYITYAKMPTFFWDDGGMGRIDYFHCNHVRRIDGSLLAHRISRVKKKILNKSINLFMKKLKITRSHKYPFYGGDSWINLTYNCVEQIIGFLKRNKAFLWRFKYTSCADEIFFQTLILNHIKNVEVENNSLRFIDWTPNPDNPGSPQTITSAHYSKILSSDALFARKFDQKVDSEIIEKVYKLINIA